MRGSQVEARAYALRLLGYRARSRNEVRERLNQKGFSSEETDKTVRYLQERGFLQDRVLAQELFRIAVEQKQLGRQGIEAFLRKRGLERDTIKETLALHTDIDERQSALRFVQQRLRSMNSFSDGTVKRRLWAALRRRGFSAEVIRTALQSIRT